MDICETTKKSDGLKNTISSCNECVSKIEKITLCGDNCLECPLYLAKTEEEKKKVAELWYRVGWRDKIVSADEISCNGCSSHKQCTYNLVECVKKNGVEKCSQCREFPCEKINSMLRRSFEYKKNARKCVQKKNILCLKKPFLEKTNI